MQKKSVIAAFDGGLREQTPPANRRGPSMSIGAQRLRHASPTSTAAESGGDSGTVTTPRDSDMGWRSPVKQDRHAHVLDGACIFVPTVEHMTSIMSQPQHHVPPATSPKRRAAASPRNGASVAAVGQPPVIFSLGSTALAPANTTSRLVSHESVGKSLEYFASFVAAIPRCVPDQPLHSHKYLRAVVEARAAMEAVMHDARADIAALGLKCHTLVGKVHALEKALADAQHTANVASDLAVASDAQLVTMHEELKRVHEEKKWLAAEFEKKLHELTHLAAPQARTLASEFRTAECARMELECGELRAQLSKRNGWLMERTALVETAQREQRAREAMGNKLAERDAQVLALREEIAFVRAQRETSERSHTEERNSLTRELDSWRKQRSVPRQTAILRAAMHERGQRLNVKTCWDRWVAFHSERCGTASHRFNNNLATSDADVASSDTFVLEGKLLKLKEEKAILMRELAKVTQRADEQMLNLVASQRDLRAARSREEAVVQEVTQLKKRHSDLASCSTSSPQSPTGNNAISFRLQQHDDDPQSLVELAENLSKAPPVSRLDIDGGQAQGKKKRDGADQDPQVQALKAYHMLATVLQGLKRRLGIASLKIPSLPIAERTTEAVSSIVFRWIQDVFEFLHHVMGIEDRLLKTKVKLTYINVQLKPSIRRVEAQLRFSSSDAAVVSVLKRQLAGYVEIQQAVKAMKGHIDATLRALLSSSDSKKQEQIGVLTSTFEADVSDFMMRVQANRHTQFQFELQLVHLRQNRQELIERLLREDKQKPTKQRNAASQPASPAKGSPLTAVASPAKDVEPQKVTIGDLLPTLKRFDQSSVGSWEQQDSRPVTAETLEMNVKLESAEVEAVEGAKTPTKEDNDEPPPVDEVSGGGDDDAGTPRQTHEVPVSSQKSAEHSGEPAAAVVTPMTLKIAAALDAHKSASRVVAPSPSKAVLDTWAARKREGWRICSLLEGDADGRLGAKEFLRLSKELTDTKEIVRRRLDAEVEMLMRSSKSRVPPKHHNSPVVGRSISQTEDNRRSPSRIRKGPASSSPLPQASTAAQQSPSASPHIIPARDNLQRPSVASLSHPKLHIPLKDSNEILHELLPRLGEGRAM